MSLDTRTLCRYRLERAWEDLMTAESNHQSGFFKEEDSEIQLNNAKMFFQAVQTYLQKNGVRRFYE